MEARREEEDAWQIKLKWWRSTVRPLIVNRWKEQGVVISATLGPGLGSVRCLVVFGPETVTTALAPLPCYHHHWPESFSLPARSSSHLALCNADTISQYSHSGINKTSCWHVSVPVGITRSVSSFTSPPR